MERVQRLGAGVNGAPAVARLELQSKQPGSTGTEPAAVNAPVRGRNGLKTASMGCKESRESDAIFAKPAPARDGRRLTLDSTQTGRGGVIARHQPGTPQTSQGGTLG